MVTQIQVHIPVRLHAQRISTVYLMTVLTTDRIVASVITIHSCITNCGAVLVFDNPPDSRFLLFNCPYKIWPTNATFLFYNAVLLSYHKNGRNTHPLRLSVKGGVGKVSNQNPSERYSSVASSLSSTLAWLFVSNTFKKTSHECTSA